MRNKVVHYDPEFETFSYGEVSNPKRGALLKLKHGDILAFYFGSKVDAELGCYIFGYFEINKIYEWKSGNDDINEEIIRVCKNNAHIISSKSKKNLVIIKGSNRSKLLQKCVKFTQTNRKSNNPPYVTIKSFREKYGIREYVHRAVPIHIKEQVHINNFKDLLNIDF